MRTNIVLNDELVNEGLKLSGLKTKRELVSVALTEFVQALKCKDLRDLRGSRGLDPDYDYKKLRIGD